MGFGIVTTLLTLPGAERVVARPAGPLAALRIIAGTPGELDALVVVEAMTNPFARSAIGVLGTIPADRRYVGRRADLVMTPFLLPGKSRFSQGLFGVFYAAKEIDTALWEAAHHQAIRLKATAAPVGTTIPMYSISPAIDVRIVDGMQPDIDQAIYDPDSYAASSAFGAKIHSDGHNGIVYRSVRNPGGTCAALFWPDAIKDVRDGFEWRFYFNGSRISEISKVV